MQEQALRVLVPLDGSGESEGILTALPPLRRARDVRFTLFRAIAPGTSAGPVRAYLREVAARMAGEGIEPEVRCEWGVPAEEILRLARGLPCDLIAMTTHGRKGLQRLKVGSVAETVLRQAEVPVLFNRPGTPVRDWMRIVAALDGSAAGQEILGDAVSLGRPRGSTVHLLRVAPPTVRASEHRLVPFIYDDEDPRPYLEGVCNLLARQGVFAVAAARQGDPAEEICAYAAEVEAGLLCLMTHGRRGFRRLFEGSVAERVVRSAPCLVLVRRMSALVRARTPEEKSAMVAP